VAFPQITKTKTTTYVITQVAIDMLTFDEHYRRIRGNFRYKGFGCYSCGKHFHDGEELSLIFTNKGNRLVCRDCGTKFKNELEAI